MDHEPPIASGPSDDRQRPPPSLLGPDSSADLPTQEDSSAPPLIMPTSKKDILREQFLRNTHRETGNGEPFYPEPYDPPHDVEEAHPHTSSAFSTWGLPLLLFVLTIFTTLWAGAYQIFAYQPFFNYRVGPLDFLINHTELLIYGIPFSATLLIILVTHEFGHYVLSRIHRIPASLPLFIPGPPHFIGTFGAVIRMKSPIMNRRALFDIGVAGPIAGFITAVIALLIGLPFSEVIPRANSYGPYTYGTPLLLQFLGWLHFGPIPPTHHIALHPIAFAAWFGFFVTAINLLPLGQLDGGHVVYAVLGRRQRSLAIAIIPILLYLGFTGWPGWILWVGLAGIVGIAHPPVSDPYTLLGKKRRWIAWAALVIFIVTFAPVPFSVN